MLTVSILSIANCEGCTIADDNWKLRVLRTEVRLSASFEINELHQAEFFRSQQSLTQSRNFPHFMELEISLTCLQEHIIGR
jgi:hypothetical protein